MKKFLIVVSLLAFFWPMAVQAETNTVTSTVTGTTTVGKTPPLQPSTVEEAVTDD